MTNFVVQDILKFTERAGQDTTALKNAMVVMCDVPKAANDMMQVGRLQGFNVSIHVSQSILICQNCLEPKPRPSGLLVICYTRY